jgi:hypothetical protein
MENPPALSAGLAIANVGQHRGFELLSGPPFINNGSVTRTAEPY